LISVDEQTRKKLNHAFLDHSVIAIRDQKLNAPQFLEAMKFFGEIFLQHNPRFAVPECPQIHYISNQDKFEDGESTSPARDTTPITRMMSSHRRRRRFMP
jgi:taurine dioxygenase